MRCQARIDMSVRVSLASAAKYLPEEPTAHENISQGRLSNLHEAQLTNAEAREVSWVSGLAHECCA